MADVPRTRRAALEAIGLAALGAAGLWRFLTPKEGTVGEPSESVRVLEGDVPSDGALVLPQFGVAVVRRGTEFLALDLACTHLGCTVTATESGFACPCHGSRFGCTGDVLSGPAPRPLRRLAVERGEGVLRVPRGQGASGKVACAHGSGKGRES
jgi:Rieske Fe-S protein